MKDYGNCYEKTYNVQGDRPFHIASSVCVNLNFIKEIGRNRFHGLEKKNLLWGFKPYAY